MDPIADLSPLKPDSVRFINIDVFFTTRGQFSRTITVESDSKKNPMVTMEVNGIVY